jgi:multidrug efflux pump subunit AcrA (membrane-fusion protein)
MFWRRFLVLVLAAATTTVLVAAPPSSERKSSKKGSSLSRKKSKEDETPAEPETPATAQPGSGQIVIHRQPVHLRGPEKYQISMHLEPRELVRIASPFDGTVKAVLRKPGQKVEPAAEIARMDVTAKQLMLERAKALYKIAELEAGQSGGKAGSEGGTAELPVARQIAEARLAAAKADLDLASYWVEQGTLRAPFTGEVFAVGASEGQVVRLGDTLAVVGDTSSLKVEVPIDRAATSVGQSLSVKVEDQVVNGKVDALLPLSPRFEPLRDLLPSAALASVTIKNSEGTLRAGQTVYSPLIPRDPVADVPNSCIGNIGDGGHKVQVLRGDTVRDVPIATLAPVGPDRSFVSGTFRDSDELIESSSQELADGTVLHPSMTAAAAPAKGKGNGRATTAQSGDKSSSEKSSGGGL